jgi:hypothetical protein
MASVALMVCVLHCTNGTSRQAQVVPTVESGADATNSAAWRYFHAGARHWRNCLLSR